jgi:hypothetical protein
MATGGLGFLCGPATGPSFLILAARSALGGFWTFLGTAAGVSFFGAVLAAEGVGGPPVSAGRRIARISPEFRFTGAAGLAAAGGGVGLFLTGGGGTAFGGSFLIGRSTRGGLLGLTRGAGFVDGVLAGRAASAGLDAAAGGFRRSFLPLSLGLFAAKMAIGSRKSDMTTTATIPFCFVKSNKNRLRRSITVSFPQKRVETHHPYRLANFIPNTNSGVLQQSIFP